MWPAICSSPTREREREDLSCRAGPTGGAVVDATARADERERETLGKADPVGYRHLYQTRKGDGK